MNLKVLQKVLQLNVFLLVIALTSCSVGTEIQKKFGVDSEYFAGLRLLEQQNLNGARNKFEKCAKKGSYYCARKSLEALTTFGSIQEKNQAINTLCKKYPDQDSLLLAAKHYFQLKDYSKILAICLKTDYSKDYNEIIKIKLEAMKHLNSANFDEAVFLWYTTRPLSDFHYKFWRDILYPSYPDFEHIETNNTQLNFIDDYQKFVINFRINLYKRDYTYCLRLAPTIQYYLENDILSPNGQLASDLGKTYLYGSPDFSNNGLKFRNLAKTFEQTEMEYYFWFYAARFFEKSTNHGSMCKKSFENAIRVANTSEQKDNAIWYLLNTSLNVSVDSIVEKIVEYSRIWSNPEYFEDFFDSLITSLIASGKWNSFYDIYSQIDGYASDETIAAYAYIYGRLLQENVATPPKEINRAQAIKQAFERALKSGSSVYYKILAAYQLNLNATQIQSLLCEKWAYKNPVTEENTSKINRDAEILLEGYAYFGFPELIYENFLELYQQGLSTDTFILISDFLRKCGKEENDYYTQSLRIATRAASYGNRNFTKQELKLLYPDNYANYVEKSCKTFDMNPWVVYALIRSESFFDVDVSSSVGAVGLTQIMESTGADIAHRLKKTDYDLTDAETNIEFGVYYLSNLYRRCDYSYLKSFAAYNAGLTKVRRWQKGSIMELGEKKNLYEDIFLETIPIAETREYGRKLISASVMYEWLYENEIPSKEAFTVMTEMLIK